MKYSNILISTPFRSTKRIRGEALIRGNTVFLHVLLISFLNIFIYLFIYLFTYLSLYLPLVYKSSQG